MRWSLVIWFFLVGCLDFLKEEPKEDEDTEREEGQQQGDCFDGEDNDEDGDIDCDDDGCFDKPACESEINDTGEDSDTGTDTEDTGEPFYEDPDNGDCWDGLDNDSDGLTDCDDPDCDSVQDCNPDNIDNDGDGYTADNGDCNDYDPSVYPGAYDVPENGIDEDCDGNDALPTTETDCTNGMDDDGDGDTDCDDPDCIADPSCTPAESVCEDTCVGQWGIGIGANNGQCEDGGIGDNFSALIGATTGFCALGTDCADCGNRIDADGDGHEDNPASGALMWDCDDSDANVNSSASEVAGNGLDDDCDGTIDNSGSSSETDCSNGVDDDSDGDVDCDDSDCVNDSACSGTTGETDCSDGTDNDADGYVDCQDSDCFNDPSCPTACSTGEEPDCNGNCAPSTWIGDGECDDGTYSWNGAQIYFNCTQFNNDNGDCP